MAEKNITLLDDSDLARLPSRELDPKFKCRDYKSIAAEDYIDYGHALSDIPEARHVHSVSGRGVRVAVLDTGIDAEHLDLKVVKGVDFTLSPSGWRDVQGHGTHCAGIIGARSNNYGVMGVAPECDLYAVKVLGDDGTGTLGGIAAGIRWSVRERVDVISMSLGGEGRISESIKNALDEAMDAGIIVVVAAGNSGPKPDSISAPGNYVRCVTVGAVDKNREIAEFSSRGVAVDVCAAGVDVVSTYAGGGFAILSGTSMATPYVAGVAALLVEACKRNSITPTHAMFQDAVRETAADLGLPGFDTSYGCGLLQAVKVLDTVLKSPPVVPAPPPVHTGKDVIITFTAVGGFEIISDVTSVEFTSEDDVKLTTHGGRVLDKLGVKSVFSV